jgi:DNA sulfur modification protein DndB
MSISFEYTFPSIRGVQAGREYYISMCPLKLIPKIFLFNEDELPPEVRAQRTLNKSRIPALAKYLLDNPKDYVFSALTASIDVISKFEAIGDEAEENRLGTLHIPMEAQFIINDGQHRRAAIEMAIKENPSLGDESIAVVFFLDYGLKRCQQMFADLNRYAVRPSSSLSVLYDHRDDIATATKLVVFKSPLFNELIERELTTLSLRSKKLFTLSAIFTATKQLIKGQNFESSDELEQVIDRYWTKISEQIPEWRKVKEGSMTAGQVREQFLHSHGVTLQALGRVGNALLEMGENDFVSFNKLSSINWSRKNVKEWEGRAMLGGRVSKSAQNVVLTSNAIKKLIGVKLTPEEQSLEKEIKRARQ